MYPVVDERPLEKRVMVYGCLLRHLRTSGAMVVEGTAEGFGAVTPLGRF